MDNIESDIKTKTFKEYPKILLVDDKEANLIALKKVFKNEQAQLVFAKSGNEALKLMLEHEFALALLDVQMPEMDGYELAEIMRSDENTSSIPIIFISAIFTNKLNVFKGFEMGAFSFITKPFEPIVLLNKVQFFLSKYLTEKAFEDSRNKYMNLYNSSPDMLLSIDYKTTIIKDCNATLLKNLGYSRDEIIGTQAFKLCDRSCVEKAKTLFKNFKVTDPSLNDTLVVNTKSGAKIDVQMKAEVILDADGQIICFNTSLSDVTELTKTKSTLQKTLSDLESYHEELKRFVFLTSHDLQEPLVTVQSFMGLIQEEYDSVLDASGKEYIFYCLTAANRMKQMVTALLEYLRIGQIEESSKIDLKVSTKKIIKDLSETIQQSGAIVNFGDLPVMNSNEEEMELLFHHIISNAIKFKQTNVKPIIDINAVEEDEFWKFTVTDNGIGIAEKQIGKVFQMFRQLHKRGKYDGIGSGLSICKKIVEKNGGRIWVESEENVGTSFIFTLPK
jgi:PAS domain S-box-containing protein